MAALEKVEEILIALATSLHKFPLIDCVFGRHRRALQMTLNLELIL